MHDVEASLVTCESLRRLTLSVPRTPDRSGPVDGASWGDIILQRVGKNDARYLWVVLTMNERLLTLQSPVDRCDFVKQCFRVLDEHECVVGNVDCDLAINSESGGYMSTLSPPYGSWRNCLEYNCFMDSLESGEPPKVPGVTWATYLGATLRQRSGLGAELLSDFRANPGWNSLDRSGEQDVEHWAEEYPSGGVLLALSLDPLEVAEAGMAPGLGVNHAVWLRKRLKQAGVLV
jgi:hypothetical protein